MLVTQMDLTPAAVVREHRMDLLQSGHRTGWASDPRPLAARKRWFAGLVARKQMYPRTVTAVQRLM